MLRFTRRSNRFQFISRRKIRHNKPWIGAARTVLGFGNHAPSAIPGAGGVFKLAEDSMLLAVLFVTVLRFVQPRLGERQKPVIPGQSEHITDIITITPAHQSPAAPARRGYRRAE